MQGGDEGGSGAGRFSVGRLDGDGGTATQPACLTFLMAGEPVMLQVNLYYYASLPDT